MVHLENRLSKHPHYAIIKAQIANLEKLTDLSEEAVSLISGDYSPYSKVSAWPVKYIEVNGDEHQNRKTWLKSRTFIPELLATEELEPKCRNCDKKFKYKVSIIRFNY